MDNNYSLGTVNLGLGGLGNQLAQQVQDEENERKKKLVNLGLNRQPGQAQTALGALNIFGAPGG